MDLLALCRMDQTIWRLLLHEDSAAKDLRIDGPSTAQREAAWSGRRARGDSLDYALAFADSVSSCPCTFTASF